MGSDSVDRRKNSTEARVARIWDEVLGLESGSRSGSFFALGGDSLLATRLVSRINAELSIELPLRAVFDHPHLEQLIQLCRSRRPSKSQHSSPSLRKRAQRALAAISFSQERMWIMHELASASAAYHVTLALDLRGSLNADALKRALELIVDRHDVLRTTYLTSEHGIVSRVHPRRDSILEELEISDDELQTCLTTAANVSFPLDRGPLFRALLARMSGDRSVLLLVMHHIVADQWSLDVILRDLAQAYACVLSNAPWRVAELPMTYAEYAGWQRRWFLATRLSTELAYWRRQLHGLEPTMLPTDFPRPPQKSFRGAKIRLDFDPDLKSRLEALAARFDASLAIVLLTALKIVLQRYTSSDDIAVGVPIANRQHLVAEPLVGTCVNTLVIRSDLSGDPDFASALARVRETCLQAYEHQNMPFEMLVKELQLPRDPSRSALFSVMFNMLNTPLGAVELEGLTWSRLDFDKQAAQFDLTVTVDATLDRSICFEYSTDLFKPETMHRLAAHYMRLLRVVLSRQDLRLSRIEMLETDDMARLRSFETGPALTLDASTVTQLLERSFERYRDRVALSYQDQIFTYAQLDAASRCLASRLSERGIRPGSKVGLHLPRSPSLLISQLAVLRSGAAYVPLDPAYPSERLGYMSVDAHLDLLLTQDDQRPSWLSDACPLLPVDEEHRTSDTDTALPAPAPNDPAYVIYTSGSTGRPKGVVVPHRAVVNFLLSMAREPGLGQEDRLLAVTTLSFDIAVLELLLPLVVGAQIVLASQEDAKDGDALKRLIERHQVTALQATPSTWWMLFASGWTGSKALKALVGGEPLPRDLASQLVDRCKEAWNMYGPTETTVWSTCWRIEAPDRNGVSVGKPISNTKIYVLDRHGNQCPIGVPGEIYIGGLGVASGYFERPELTSERFVLDPRGERADARMYRTGDRGRWRSDGTLEHLGRLDNQVKVRGHRIELGEIEAQLKRCLDVEQAVVVAREEAPGDVRLSACFVPRGPVPDVSSIREQLREWLPEYMLPQSIVPVPAIPTLPNGKVAVNELPLAPAHATKERVEPRTALERSLWSIWRDVLRISNFGVHDDFFELGGHSMLAMRVLSRIRNELHQTCTLRAIFQYPTIAALAHSLKATTQVDANTLIPLQPRGFEPPLFCICGIQIYQELANEFAPDIPVYGVYVPMELDLISSETTHSPSVQQLAAEYLRTIRSAQAHGPYRLVGFSLGGVLAYEMSQQLRNMGEHVSLLAILDSDVPRLDPDGLPIGRRLRILQHGARLHLKNRLDALRQRLASEPSPEIQRDRRYLAAIHSYTAAPYEGAAVYVEAVDGGAYDPGYSWSDLIKDLRMYRVPGDHLGVLQAPNTRVVANYIKSHLREHGADLRVQKAY